MKFFETLPRALKVILHVVELALCLYAVLSLVLMLTPFAPYTNPYLPFMGIAFMVGFPIIHAIIEICFGVPGTEPTLGNKVAGKLQDALMGTLDRATSIDVKTVPKPDADGPSDAKP